MKQDRIPQLQGLRGLAMLGIFLMHTQSFWSYTGFGKWNFIADDLGRSGVIIFIMLSGFLLTYKEKEIPILQLTDRLKVCRLKFHRLYLLYVLTLVIAFFGYGRIPQTPTDWFYAAISLPLCLTYTQDLIPHVGINISYNGPSWYISALFIIWLLIYTFPEKINTIRRLGSKQCLKAILVIVAVQLSYKCGEYYFPTHLIPINHPQIYMAWISYFNPFYNLSYFVLGCFIGRLALLQHRSFFPWVTLAFVVMFVSLTLIDLFIPKLLKPLFFEIFISVLLLIIMYDNSILKTAITIPPLVRFGNISASFFLIHGVVNYHLRYAEDYITKPWLFFLSFVLSLVLSILSEKYLILKKHESILQHLKKIA